MQNLSQDQFRSFILALPTFDEQFRIAEFLQNETAKIDALVAEQQRLIELLKEKRQAVISHAVTKGLNPDAPMKDSGVEWLGEVPYLRVANVQDGYLDLKNVTNIEIPLEDLERYRLQDGDVLMNEGGDFDKLGRGYVWCCEIEPCIHQNHVFAVRPFLVSSDWLNLVTGTIYAQLYFITRSKQSTNLASISSTNVMELPVVILPETEQTSIAAFLNHETAKLDTLTAEAQRAIALLQERRTALISAAVTGKIDVRGLASDKLAVE